MYFKKTLVLSSLMKTDQKALVNIEKNKNNYIGNLRLYNFKSEPEGILTLGFLRDGKVIKAGLKPKTKFFYEFSVDDTAPLSSFTCALMQIKDGMVLPIMIGTTDGKNVSSMDMKLANSISLLDEKNLNIKTATKILNKNSIDYDDEEKREINKVIDSQIKNTDDVNKCNNCQYREAFFNYNESSSKAAKVLDDKIKIVPQKFYEEIMPQLDTLFEQYEPEEFLQNIIPNSKWVKVDYENNGHYYVIGLIFEKDDVRFVCYGIPGVYDVEPPKELGDNPKWLPLEETKPYELGYWLLYQNADTGERENVDVI